MKNYPTPPKNFFDNIPSSIFSEIFEPLHVSGSLRIERILSRGHRTPEGEWYDQVDDEWVLILHGSASVEFADGSLHDLEVGDYLNIPAHVQHRVTRTSLAKATVWLAVFSAPAIVSGS